MDGLIKLCTCVVGALIALVYALDRDTMQRLRWRNIRVSSFLQNTGDWVV